MGGNWCVDLQELNFPSLTLRTLFWQTVQLRTSVKNCRILIFMLVQDSSRLERNLADRTAPCWGVLGSQGRFIWITLAHLIIWWQRVGLNLCLLRPHLTFVYKCDFGEFIWIAGRQIKHCLKWLTGTKENTECLKSTVFGNTYSIPIPIPI